MLQSKKTKVKDKKKDKNTKIKKYIHNI